MIDAWILDKIEPLAGAPVIILRDPQRMIRHGAAVVHGWGKEHDYYVIYATGNLGFRDLYEAKRLEDPGARFLLVDRTRQDAKRPLFYPDLIARARPHKSMLTLTLRDFLVQKTGDPHWPAMVNDRRVADLVTGCLGGVLRAYAELRRVDRARFSDRDFYLILSGALLNFNPFRTPDIADIRRICLEGYPQLNVLKGILPQEAMDSIRAVIERAPFPFNRLLEQDQRQIITAFTLAAVMRQHGIDHRLHLANLDPELHAYKDIEGSTLDQALQDFLRADREGVARDTRLMEEYLIAKPQRLAYLCESLLKLDDPAAARAAIEKERFSPLLRSLALASLLVDLIAGRGAEFHRKVLDTLEAQERDADLPANLGGRPEWADLLAGYRRAISVVRLMAALGGAVAQIQAWDARDLSAEYFYDLWVSQGLDRLDYYCEDLDRILRVRSMLPVKSSVLWKTFEDRWTSARKKLKDTYLVVDKALNVINRKFQDLYHLNYTQWINQPDAPFIFTHQFLARGLGRHWHAQAGKKAVVLIFDGLRTDAWREFLLPVFEEYFEVVEQLPASAILPTETELSRKAIAGGCMPEAFGREHPRESVLLERWLKDHMSANVKFEARVEDDQKDAGMAVHYASPWLDYVIFKFSDDNLHHNHTDLPLIYRGLIENIVNEDVRALLRELPEDITVFVTSDHGFSTMPKETVDVSEGEVGEPQDVKYRVARTKVKEISGFAQKTVAFDARQMQIGYGSQTRRYDPVNYVVFPRPGYIFRRPVGRHDPDKYHHGGLSMAECLIPLVVLRSRRKASDPLQIADARQTGSAAEGTPLSIEVEVRAAQALPAGVPISLQFSDKRFSGTREVFLGQGQTYRFDAFLTEGDIMESDIQVGEWARNITVTLAYSHEGREVRASRSLRVVMHLDTDRIRRRSNPGLDILMGKGA